jgi:hypothetical protein
VPLRGHGVAMRSETIWAGKSVSENGVQPRILAVLEKVNASDPVALKAVSREIHSAKSPCGFANPTLPGSVTDRR